MSILSSQRYLGWVSCAGLVPKRHIKNSLVVYLLFGITVILWFR